jgi:hypothetical protein
MDAELVAWEARARGCADVQLMAELQQLVRKDRRGEARMLMYLAEVDERRLFLELGHTSLFRYATAVLRMSEPQAYLRIQAARLARRYPGVLELFAEGALNLSTIKLLDPHLTLDNYKVLLERARNKTKREVALLIAEVAPLPDVPNQIRKLPAPAASKRRDGDAAQRLAAPAVVARPVEAGTKDVAAAQTSAASAEVSERLPIAFALEAPRASCTPLRPGRFKLELTASQSLHDKLMQPLRCPSRGRLEGDVCQHRRPTLRQPDDVCAPHHAISSGNGDTEQPVSG